MSIHLRLAALVGLSLGLVVPSGAQSQSTAVAEQDSSTYVLGPGDELTVSAVDVQEFAKEPYRIAMDGTLTLPLAGSLPATGLTTEQITAAIRERLSKYVKSPDVTVNLLEMRSQPVSVLGEVRNPGVVQLMGQKSLFEVLSLAGGLNPDAGTTIRITRERQWGTIPLAGAKSDDSGQFWVAEIAVKDVLNGSSPGKNISIKPNDVITVPKGEIVYVLGAVKKSGGFVLDSRDRVTVLQALAMAEGLDHFASTANAKIVRKTGAPGKPEEIRVDVGRLLRGKSPDIALADNDILFVPVSGTKQAISRTVEAGFNIGTGIAIWRP